jgi:hypothetical protein
MAASILACSVGWSAPGARAESAGFVGPPVPPELAEARALGAVEPPVPGPILLIGDSMMKVGVGPVLKRTLAEKFGTRVELDAKSSTGLARPDFYDWPQHAEKALSKDDYRTIVAILGTNDCQALTHKGKRLQYGTPGWKEAYQARLRGLIETLCQSGRRLIWLGLPPMKMSGFNKRIADLNDLIESETRQHACATYVPTRRALGDARGAFVATRAFGPRKLPVRDPDGIHVTAHGGELVSELVVEALGD